MVDTLKTDKNFADEEIDNKSDAPKLFGERVASDSIVARKKEFNLYSPSRGHNFAGCPRQGYWMDSVISIKEEIS